MQSGTSSPLGASIQTAEIDDGAVTDVKLANPPVYKFVGSVTLSVAGASMQVSSLDLGSDEKYIIRATLKKDGTQANIQFEVNGDTTDANYDRTRADYSGSSAGVETSADSQCGFLSANGQGIWIAEMFKDVDGVPNAIVSCIANDTETPNWRQYYITHGNDTTNVTSIELISSSGNFAIGSKLEIWKVTV